ncbi:hypothetical protein M427DRAFT_54532 [Gonapodya prolifera JEL478]|uniref:N-acetyltransferase domain-containing protein n=1 Tax=Gonapodya prolifera (strain JEL478) TaxID=1344416 RepID=A0A139AM60_GONPJ|nr:hypothetical protein M427DRAFT_54532 [Gonapodya prolifera JEL478]|eukprot:KXS17603.1 hypothetical protein M427DRAFT_54532 [Gonapodya prolifera JEL478]
MEYYREIVGDGTGNCFTVVLDKDFLEWKKGDVCAIAVCANESWNGTQILWEFHVHPDFQGQGIGRQLMDHICDIARKQGLTRLEVETKNRNVGGS